MAYLEPVKRYVLLYNSGKPRGIIMRWSVLPRGPWSEGVVLFNPKRDDGYGRFIHVPPSASGIRDGLSDAKQMEVRGGEYGPFIMSRYTKGNARDCRIYFTMSTWNPYQVMVMQSDLRIEN